MLSDILNQHRLIHADEKADDDVCKEQRIGEKPVETFIPPATVSEDQIAAKSFTYHGMVSPPSENMQENDNRMSAKKNSYNERS